MDAPAAAAGGDDASAGRGRARALTVMPSPYYPQLLPRSSPSVSAAVSSTRRAAPRSTRRLYHAEQLMEERKLPKKKYLATQRLRRDLERSSVESLKLDVNFLRQEIVNLRTVREIVQAQRLTTRVDTAAGLMGKVAQLYSTLKYGVGGESATSRLSASDKIRFLRSVMHADVHFGASASARGLDKFIQQCAGYTLFHSLFYTEAPKMREVPSSDAIPIIVATTRVRVRVSRMTLATMFPHTLADEVLVQELIGQELFYPCEARIYFNGDGKIVRHDAEIDFVAGLNAVLQSLRKVTEIMDHARLDGVVILMDGDIDLSDLVCVGAAGDDDAQLREMKTAVVSRTLLAKRDDAMVTVPAALASPVVNRMSIGMLLS